MAVNGTNEIFKVTQLHTSTISGRIGTVMTNNNYYQCGHSTDDGIGLFLHSSCSLIIKTHWLSTLR